MNNLIFLIIVLIICVISYLITDYINNIDYFVIDSKNPGPTLLIISGTHGNEPAGTIGSENFLKNNINISKGKIIIIPRVNKIGLFFGIRLGFNGFIPIDFNRTYPSDDNDIKNKTTVQDKINKQVIELIKQSDFILDFHEGWGYAINNSNSMGSGLYPSKTDLAISICNDLLSINNEISDPKKKFIINLNHDNLKGTLGTYTKNSNLNYILIETTGQNNIQPIDTRVYQVLFFINTTLKKLNMIN
jgi:hypothetical protein